jgi:3-isopropylmalate/(R)-2-methylmalate dehydratase small subunit
MVGSGRAFVLGDDIDTDVLAPGSLMKLPPAELAKHCLEAIDPSFASSVRPGDIVVAGRNFGLGSSREQAAESLRILGIYAVVAESFARIFYRNAFNLGLVAIVCPQAREIANGDTLRIDPGGGLIENLSQNKRYQVGAVPDQLLKIVEDGGLLAHLERRFAGVEAAP